VLRFVEAILSSTLDFAPSVVLAALGGVISERSGVVNLGLEGMMRLGAFFAAAATLATGNPWLGLGAGMLAGACGALMHAWLSIRWRSDQVVSGIALNLVALGGVTFLVEALYGRTDTEPSASLGRLSLGALENVPLLRAFTNHSWLAWGALAAPFLLHFVLYRTALGLRILAVGEKPQAAATLGIKVNRLRYACVLASGFFAGLGGASLSVSTLNQFNNHMPAGQGFMALAAMVFGKWTPLGAFGAALFFAAANALRISLASSLPWVKDVVPSGFLLALPYLLTLLLLAGFVGRARAPAADGVPYDPEMR
jgi:general nucleoside transport system permease protein